jgi:hypothetical protein
MQLSTKNVITSLSTIATLDWGEIIELETERQQNAKVDYYQCFYL